MFSMTFNLKSTYTHKRKKETNIIQNIATSISNSKLWSQCANTVKYLGNYSSHLNSSLLITALHIFRIIGLFIKSVLPFSKLLSRWDILNWQAPTMQGTSPQNCMQQAYAHTSSQHSSLFTPKRDNFLNVIPIRIHTISTL
jgi:hypothetical protein